MDGGNIRKVKTKTMDGGIESYEVAADMAIDDFKKIVETKTGIPLNRIRLIYRGRVLEGPTKLSESIKEDDEIIHLLAKNSEAAQASQANASQPNSHRQPRQPAPAPAAGNANPISGIFGNIDLGNIGGLINQMAGAANGGANNANGQAPQVQEVDISGLMNNI